MKTAKMTRGRKGMAAIATRREKMQEINMCIQTYFNLYGQTPSLQEMLEWLGNSYRSMLVTVFSAPCA